MAGTREDATMMIQLAQWGSAMGLDQAVATIWADDFDADTADARDEAVRRVLNWNETLGTLVKNGLLDRDLVYDWLWVEGAWNKVGPAAVRAREQAGVPQLYENFEALAAGQRLGAGAPA
jgi:hypothetical protein